MNNSSAFDLLHDGVKRWIWSQQWEEFRDIQEQAIKPILNADRDIIISAATAAGKTEAAFLPACSHIATMKKDGVSILYISPLKALINDQYRRLQSLCEMLDIPVTPWHGDVLLSVKKLQKKNPRGIILITPESLESLLLNQSQWCLDAFCGLSYIIIDEFHAFIGTERGCQLQSLMHRLEFMLKRIVPRIALSATLSDMPQVARYLRPNNKLPYEIIESKTSRSDVKIQLRGYLNPKNISCEQPTVLENIKNDLYQILRGKSHLIFPNRKALTEEIAAYLSDRCSNEGLPNEFFVHHGSLSKEIRETLETRLQDGKIPTTAVCTTTLELGIDISSVNSIAQINPPHSVSSLRQRLGRSGRRDEAAILRMFIIEEEITAKSHIIDKLRLQTVQCIAVVNLLLKKWCEPAPNYQYHLSTLVQQTLSVIGQFGGVTAKQLWALLCETGPFTLVDQSLYVALLKVLGKHELITQTHDRQIILGCKGERLVEHYAFYTAFKTPDEYRLECDGKILGTIPISKHLASGQIIIFAGKRWEILAIYEEKKLVVLKRGLGGKAPLFEGSAWQTHDIIRQEMLNVYKQRITPAYLDRNAKMIFEEGIEHFYTASLDKVNLLQNGNTLHIFTWLGDKTANTIVAILCKENLRASCDGGVIDIIDTSAESFKGIIKRIINKPKPQSADLADEMAGTFTSIEKYDNFLTKELRAVDYGTKFFDIDAAWSWINSTAQS